MIRKLIERYLIEPEIQRRIAAKQLRVVGDFERIWMKEREEFERGWQVEPSPDPVHEARRLKVDQPRDKRRIHNV